MQDLLDPLLQYACEKGHRLNQRDWQRWEGWSDRCKFWTPSSEKPTELLNEQEFCECFCIPNGVSVHLVDGNPMSIEKAAQGAIFFSKEQFNVGLRFPLQSLFKQFLHYTQIPPAHIHPNIVRV